MARFEALAVKARGVGASFRLTVEGWTEGVWVWVREEGVWDLAEGVWEREAEEVDVEEGPERERWWRKVGGISIGKKGRNGKRGRK